MFRDIKVDTDIKYDEEEKFALLNSFKQIVTNDNDDDSDYQLESDLNEEPDDFKTDPVFEFKLKKLGFCGPRGPILAKNHQKSLNIAP